MIIRDRHAMRMLVPRSARLTGEQLLAAGVFFGVPRASGAILEYARRSAGEHRVIPGRAVMLNRRRVRAYAPARTSFGQPFIQAGP
jgi:hypothetical protein